MSAWGNGSSSPWKRVVREAIDKGAPTFSECLIIVGLWLFAMWLAFGDH